MYTICPPVDEAAAVTRVGHRYAQAGDLQGAAFVHRRHVLQSLARRPVTQLERGDDSRLRVARHRDEVFHVVGVPVRDEDQIDLTRLLQTVGAGRIVLEPRIEQDALATGSPHDERGMPEPRDRQPLHQNRLAHFATNAAVRRHTADAPGALGVDFDEKCSHNRAWKRSFK
jgi:hypothetical protein